VYPDNSIDFGEVKVGATSTIEAYRVTNLGGGVLSGTVTANSPFEIAAGSDFQLHEGEDQTVMISFKPALEGVIEGQAIFSSGTPTETRSLYGIGIIPSGSLTVQIQPSEAVGAGAKWKRVGTSIWLDSGYTESSIPIGEATVEFTEVAGWKKPLNQPVTINDGQTTILSGAEAKYSTSTNVEEIDSRGLPEHYDLSQNYPNPFNLGTRIEFSLPRPTFVEISILNIEGRCIRTLVSEYLSTGYKAVSWDGIDDAGREVASGVYFYRLVTEDFTDSKKMILLK
jgi:hypothetical protein